MNINQFITQSGIKPADAIVMNKKFFGMVDHYVIYLGIRNFEHAFVANYIHGVRIIPNNELLEFLKVLVPSKIEKFPGQEHQRGEALKRAISQVGQKSYDYIANNCEHFKNFVHCGIAHSTQVQKGGAGVVIGGILLTLIGANKKNGNMTGFGVLMVLIGIIIALYGTPNKDDKPK